MESTPLTLASMPDEVIPILVIAIVGGILLTLIVFSNIRRVFETRAKEMTRREIAAYVAEGSITPDDAQRLLATGSSAELEKKIGDAIAWGTISAKKAESLLRTARESANDEGAARA